MKLLFPIHRAIKPVSALRVLRALAAVVLALAGCFTAGGVTAADAEADFYISPGGSDLSAGTKDQPFASLARARDAVRALLADGADRDVTVWIAGGTYRVIEPVVFGLADSAPDGRTVSYVAAPGEEPVFSAGVPVTGWEKGEGQVWSAPLPEGLGAIKALYDGAERLTRARGPGFKPTVKATTWRNADRYSVHYPEGALRAWDNLQDVELLIIPAAPWTMNVLTPAQVDEQRLVAKMTARGTYGLEQPRFGRYEATAWIENRREFIDGPGEWAVDTQERRIYLWPKGEKPGADIVAPATTEMIRIEGAIDYEGPEDKPVRGLVFKGLAFTHAERYTREDDRIGWGIQHDWEMFDEPTAMVRLRGAEGCRIEGCTFTNSAATGIRLDLHCINNHIVGNRLNQLGGVGVLLAGYGPGTKDVNRNNFVERNHIRHIGKDYWHSPAVFVWQSGHNRIGNNLIHNTGYSGIVVSGRIHYDPNGIGECSRTVRWHEIEAVTGAREHPGPWEKRERFTHGRKNLIERNEIHDVMETMSDGNGVYISGAGRGNVVRENFIHSCTSKHFAEGIRCDDDQYETTVERNILWRLGGLATFVTIKGRNDVINNIFAEPLNPPVRGMFSLELLRGLKVDGSRVERNIFYTTRKNDRAVYQGRNYYDEVNYLRDAEADRNLYWSTADPDWGIRHLQAEQQHGSEMNSLVADPLFVDLANGDLSLREDSPALKKLGFEPIDMSVIGLPRDPD